MPCGWEGNRRSGVALATRQTLVVLHLRARGLEEGDEHLPTLFCGARLTLPFTVTAYRAHDDLEASSCGCHFRSKSQIKCQGRKNYVNWWSRIVLRAVTLYF